MTNRTKLGLERQRRPLTDDVLPYDRDRDNCDGKSLLQQWHPDEGGLRPKRKKKVKNGLKTFFPDQAAGGVVECVTDGALCRRA